MDRDDWRRLSEKLTGKKVDQRKEKRRLSCSLKYGKSEAFLFSFVLLS